MTTYYRNDLTTAQKVFKTISILSTFVVMILISVGIHDYVTYNNIELVPLKPGYVFIDGVFEALFFVSLVVGVLLLWALMIIYFSYCVYYLSNVWGLFTNYKKFTKNAKNTFKKTDSGYMYPTNNYY